MATEEIMRVGALEIRPAEFLVLAEGHVLGLTRRELSLLVELARREGRIVTRAELFAAVWGRPLRAHDRSVDVYIRKLRAKLGGALPGARYIHTHSGFGYRLSAEESSVLSHSFHNGATSL